MTYAERLERQELLHFPTCPFPLPVGDDLAFLRAQEVGRYSHKNVSYDPATNSLFLGSADSGPCGTTLPSAAIIKIPLSPDGTKLSGPDSSASICMTGGTAIGEIIGFREGPGGTLRLGPCL